MSTIVIDADSIMSLIGGIIFWGVVLLALGFVLYVIFIFIEGTGDEIRKMNNKHPLYYGSGLILLYVFLTWIGAVPFAWWVPALIAYLAWQIAEE